ncbi:MAG: M28 family peptidase [Planctomycetia bacterium]|nr:M28 family peptidase [Planctomycetia bacterium]
MRVRVEMLRRAVAWAGCLGAAIGSACAAEGPGEFSGTRAFTHLAALAALGPRPSGSAGMERQREIVVAHFQAAGGRVSRQAFQIRDRRTGQPVRMENLVVEWHPGRSDRVLLGAHYDTRPFPDRDPVDPRGTFLGVNDGASGVAVLMELASLVRDLPGEVGVDFVLFDAEEYVFAPRDPYFLGSTFFARQYAAARQADGPTPRYRCGLILDMVADRDLEIFQEQHSASWPDTRPVVDEVWGVAARMGVRQFVPRPKHAVEDDHVPLRTIGRIPTCDVIDFDYPHWHTTHDTLEQCSAESLEAVGSVVLQWLREMK